MMMKQQQQLTDIWSDTDAQYYFAWIYAVSLFTKMKIKVKLIFCYLDFWVEHFFQMLNVELSHTYDKHEELELTLDILRMNAIAE